MALPTTASGVWSGRAGLPIRLTRYAATASPPSGPRARPLNHRLYDDCQYSKLLKSYTLPNEVSGGFKLHNAKTPVMRYVHQPGFPENPREVREFAAPPGLNRGGYRMFFPSKILVGR